MPDNVLDGSLDPDSRWACRPSFSLIDVCELTFAFDEPQDISEIRMAMFKGNQRTRTVNVLVDGVLATTAVTSANTFELEAYEVSAIQASTIVLQEAGPEEDVWLSITEVSDCKYCTVVSAPLIGAEPTTLVGGSLVRITVAFSSCLLLTLMTGVKS